MKKKNHISVLSYLLACAILFTFISIAQAATGYADQTDKWAWGTNAGWINFAPTHGGMTVYDDHLEGYIWGENVGWIRLGTYEGGEAHTYANNSATTYGVNNDGNGNLSGYAWGTNIGWINFNPSYGGVTVDPATGEFDGYAWGENIGWIHFNHTGDNAYMVKVNHALVIQSNGIKSNGENINDNGTISGPVASITVLFSKDVNDPSGDADPDDVTNPSNYLLIQKGENDIYDTQDCAAGYQSDDVLIPVGPVSYDNNSGSGPFSAVVTMNNGEKLPDGEYRLYICGSTSIVDTNLSPLAGDGETPGTDRTLNFTVSAASTPMIASELPETGFAPGVFSVRRPNSSSVEYASTSVDLSIPVLGIRSLIVGVPITSNGWDLTWLDSNAGWLHGTAFPSWAGNSTITGHVYNADGLPGIFHNLQELKWGDEIIIHTYGQEYIYEVRTVDKYVSPDDTSLIYKHEDYPWLTLVTCRDYDESGDSYRWRVVVRAVQVSIQ